MSEAPDDFQDMRGDGNNGSGVLQSGFRKIYGQDGKGTVKEGEKKIANVLFAEKNKNPKEEKK